MGLDVEQMIALDRIVRAGLGVRANESIHDAAARVSRSPDATLPQRVAARLILRAEEGGDVWDRMRRAARVFQRSAS